MEDSTYPRRCEKCGRSVWVEGSHSCERPDAAPPEEVQEIDLMKVLIKSLKARTPKVEPQPETRRVIASLLSAVHANHGDVAWDIYREHAPELADYRAWRERYPETPPTRRQEEPNG